MCDWKCFTFNSTELELPNNISQKATTGMSSWFSDKAELDWLSGTKLQLGVKKIWQ